MCIRDRADDVWLVEDAGSGDLAFRNEVTGRYLDADPRTDIVDSSRLQRRDDLWRPFEVEGNIAFRNVAFGGFLTAAGPDRGFAVLHTDLHSASFWQFDIVE